MGIHQGSIFSTKHLVDGWETTQQKLRAPEGGQDRTLGKEGSRGIQRRVGEGGRKGVASGPPHAPLSTAPEPVVGGVLGSTYSRPGRAPGQGAHRGVCAPPAPGAPWPVRQHWGGHVPEVKRPAVFTKLPLS